MSFNTGYRTDHDCYTDVQLLDMGGAGGGVKCTMQ